MPNPKSSGTGYVFVKSLVNENILQFSSSGSGSVNSLIQGETAIALGMTSQGVLNINQGNNLKIVFFEEGSPYNAYGHGIIKGKEEREAVVEVFDFFYTDLIADTRVYLRKQIKAIQKEFKTTMIYITHDQEEAFSMGDRIMVMKDGGIEQIDSPENIIGNPASDYIQHFIIDNLRAKIESIIKYVKL